MSRHRYPTEICRVFERTTAAKLQAALTSSKEPDNNEPVENNDARTNVSAVPKEKQGGRKGGKSAESSKKTGDGTHAKQAMLRTVIGEGLGYGPALAEHIILDADLIPNTKVPKDNKWEDDTVQALLQAVTKFEDWLEDIISGDKVPEGFILQKQNSEPGNTGQVTLVVLCSSSFTCTGLECSCSIRFCLMVRKCQSYLIILVEYRVALYFCNCCFRFLCRFTMISAPFY